MKDALIFLNGEPPSEASLKRVNFDEVFTICADVAPLKYLTKYCRPDLIVGDLDSIPADISLDGLKIEKYPVEKNDTDSQLAVIRAVEMGFFNLSIYGAFGGRIDHEILNYSLLALADSLGASAGLRGGKFDVDFLTPSRPFVRKMENGKIVSLVPYGGSAHILLTKGLYFHAENVVVDTARIFTTSNVVCEGEAEYRLSGGKALLFSEN